MGKTPMTVRIVDPVGPQEIADRLEVSIETVHSWRKRARLGTYPNAQPIPDPAITISGIPVWGWAAIRTWAEATGRAVA